MFIKCIICIDLRYLKVFKINRKKDFNISFALFEIPNAIHARNL